MVEPEENTEEEIRNKIRIKKLEIRIKTIRISSFFIRIFISDSYRNNITAYIPVHNNTR
jgi:hypothetical protein